MTSEPTLAARLWAGALADGTGCWIWQRSKLQDGYGQIGASGKTLRAHRVAYEFVKGPIPDGLQIDHLCRNRACINPDHMEAVTQRENILRGVSPSAQQARKTHCKRGHPFDEANTHREGGIRTCRACRRLRTRAYYFGRSIAEEETR